MENCIKNERERDSKETCRWAEQLSSSHLFRFLPSLFFNSLISLYTFLSNVFGMYPILQLDPVLSPYQKHLASAEEKECQIHQNGLKDGSCHGPAVFRIVDGAHHGLMAGFEQQAKNRQYNHRKRGKHRTKVRFATGYHCFHYGASL